MNDPKRMFLIKIAYWLGIGADALWAVALFSPQVFAILTGNPDFDPDLQTRLIMGMGGSLMTGWTLLLIWAVRKPIERRVVILLTASGSLWDVYCGFSRLLEREYFRYLDHS